MIQLFDDKVRTNAGPALLNGDTYSAYNDSADPDVTSIRNFVSNWFDHFPEQEKEDLKSRFKVKFHHAFFELFIYTLFTALGYRLTVHPDLPESNRHPDFMAVKDGQSMYLEAKFMDMQSQEQQSRNRREKELFDALNKVDARNFLIIMESVNFKDRSQPNGKKIRFFFNGEIALHDPEIYLVKLEQTGFAGMPNITYDDEHITVKVKLMPKAAHLRGTPSRAIATEPAQFKIGNDSEAIKEALETKATRYGQLMKPYIICLNKQTVSFDLQEIQEALYGDRNNPGFYGNEQNKKFTRVSGVYITNANTANLVSTAAHVFGPNPYAAFPTDFLLTASIMDSLKIPEDYHSRKLPGI